jgi:hypothetical protein
VLGLAAEKDVVICPEIHWPSVIKSKVVDDYLTFIDRTGTEHFALLMDTGVFQAAMHRRRGGAPARGTGRAGGRPR